MKAIIFIGGEDMKSRAKLLIDALLQFTVLEGCIICPYLVKNLIQLRIQFFSLRYAFLLYK